MKSAGTEDRPGAGPQGPQRFLTTHWSVVLAAGGTASTRAAEALEALCQAYWYPLYAFVRRQGFASQDAQDLTQGFFTRFLEKDYLRDVRRERGRFRSFLLASMKHFIANERDRARALKRGGRLQFVALDAQNAEDRYALEPRDELSAERVYERRWALMLLDRVLVRLRSEFAAVGKERQFDELKGTLSAGQGTARYAEIAVRLGTSDDAVKVAVHRLRRRYRELLRAEIAETVADAADVDDEIRHLVTVLGG